MICLYDKFEFLFTKEAANGGVLQFNCFSPSRKLKLLEKLLEAK